MPQHHPARIVLIEDNPGDVFLLRHALSAHGEYYQLEVMNDGDEAMRYVHEFCGTGDQEVPCVLVLDLHLPKHDGYEILQAIREKPELKGLRVAAITGLSSSQEETRIRALGVSLYRSKPVDFAGYQSLADEIIAVCNEGLGKKSAATSGY